jgi:hypothetical protein
VIEITACVDRDTGMGCGCSRILCARIAGASTSSNLSHIYGGLKTCLYAIRKRTAQNESAGCARGRRTSEGGCIARHVLGCTGHVGERRRRGAGRNRRVSGKFYDAERVMAGL